MSIDPTKTLAVCEAATRAPWGHWPEAGSIEIFAADPDDTNHPALSPGTTSSEWILVGDVRPRLGWGQDIYEPTDRRPGGDEPDAEFITTARTELPALAKFARDVLALLDGAPMMPQAVISQLAAKYGIEVAG